MPIIDWYLYDVINLLIIIKHNMIYQITLIVFMLFFVCLQAEPTNDDDITKKIPGYDLSYANRAYAGYLKTESELRKLHYVFLEGDGG